MFFCPNEVPATQGEYYRIMGSRNLVETHESGVVGAVLRVPKVVQEGPGLAMLVMGKR